MILGVVMVDVVRVRVKIFLPGRGKTPSNVTWAVADRWAFPSVRRLEHRNEGIPSCFSPARRPLGKKHRISSALGCSIYVAFIITVESIHAGNMHRVIEL